MESIAPLSDDRIEASEAVRESFNRTTMLKHSEAGRLVPRRVPVTRLDQPVTIQLDSDLMPGLLDMWGASGDPSWEHWLSEFITDALRPQLGV